MRPVLLLPVLLLAACSAGDADPGKAASGPRVARDYGLAGFDRVELKGSDDVVVRVGPAFAVRAEAPQALLDRLELTVEDGALKVGRRKDSWNWGNREDHALVTVTLPALAAATVAGSGDMTIDRVKGASFTGTVSGSGDLDAGTLEVQSAKLSLAGSGDIDAKGRARTADYSVAGSGDIDAKDLQSETLTASVAGSGNIAASARARASVSIVGSGDVTIGGGAKCTVSKVGSGDVSCG